MSFPEESVFSPKKQMEKTPISTLTPGELTLSQVLQIGALDHHVPDSQVNQTVITVELSSLGQVETMCV